MHMLQCMSPLVALSVREQHRQVRPLSNGFRTLRAA
jgi:hypothetical protein